MLKPEKEAAIEEIKGNLSSARIAILTEFQGMNVAEMNELRKLFRTADVRYKVYKNTLIRLAAEQLGVDGIDKYLFGTTALAFGKDNLVSPAKIVKDFSARHQNFRVKAGILDRKLIESEDVIELASMPPREVLIAMVLGGIQAPVSRFLSVLQGTIRNFLGVLKSISEQKEKAESIPESTSDQQTEGNQ